MKYTVFWSKAASDSLAEIWLALDSAGRRQLNQLIADLEELLRFEPEQQGESREESRRIILRRRSSLLTARFQNEIWYRFCSCD